MDSPNQERPGRGSVIIAAAIVGAALILSWTMGSSDPRYQIAASGDGIVRMDTDSGEMIACNGNGCRRIEAPDRAKIFGPLTVQIDGDKDLPALPEPANQAE